MTGRAVLECRMNSLEDETCLGMIKGFEVKGKKADIFALVLGMTGPAILLFFFVKSPAFRYPLGHFQMAGQTFVGLDLVFGCMAGAAILKARLLAMSQA
jgi:hypothetical protein